MFHSAPNFLLFKQTVQTLIRFVASLSHRWKSHVLVELYFGEQRLPNQNFDLEEQEKPKPFISWEQVRHPGPFSYLHSSAHAFARGLTAGRMDGWRRS